jgi:hypothetical protein
MNSRKRLIALLALVAAGTLGATSMANPYAPRQYYGGWQKHSRANYYYRAYYYKPKASYNGYKHHYVMYSPAKPKHYYFYNPYKKQYWGRCPVEYDGNKPQYSMLAEADRKANIEDIPEKAFPEPSDVPPIPDADDNAKLELPPDDLPAGNTSPGN